MEIIKLMEFTHSSMERVEADINDFIKAERDSAVKREWNTLSVTRELVPGEGFYYFATLYRFED